MRDDIPRRGRPPGSKNTDYSNGLFRKLTDRYKFQLVSDALHITNGDVTKAARMLEMNRTSIYEMYGKLNTPIVPLRLRVVKATGAHMPIIHETTQHTVSLLHPGGIIEVIPISQLEDWLRAGDVVLEPVKD